MKLGSRRMIFGATGTAILWVLSVSLAGGQQAGTDPNQGMAEEVFDNVQVLKGIPVDEFMGTMGVFSAALGLSCEDCHTASSNDWANYASDVSPRKATARRMVLMMAAINRTNFGGRQVVTCFTCHRGSTIPKATSSLDLLYGAPPPDELDVTIVAEPDAPAATEIFNRYLEALGGRANLAKVESYVARGTYSGYGPEGAPRPVEVYAKAPNQRATNVLDPTSGDIVWTFSGRQAWISAPFRPVDVLEMHGAEVEAWSVEAELQFPSNVANVAQNWRVGYREILDDKVVRPVQGDRGDVLVTMYFDEETGLMTRLVRSTPSPVGRLPVRIDYHEFGELGSTGVQIPFQWTMTWLDGRNNYEISEAEANVAIPASRFERPAPPKPY